MPQPWSVVEQSPDYQKLPPDEQSIAKQQYFDQVVSQKSEFKALPDEEKQAATNQFLGNNNSTTNDSGMSGPIAQAAKGFGQVMHQIPGVRQFMDLNPELKDMNNEVSEPQKWDEKLGRFVGVAAGFAPAFETGAGIAKSLAEPLTEGLGTATELATSTSDAGVIAKTAQLAKTAQGIKDTATLAGGAAGVGAQTTGEDLYEGKSPQEALQEGAGAAARTFVGGKVLEGGAKAVGDAFANLPQGARDVAGRIHDMIVRLPTKAFQYGKDPLDVMQKEGIVANSTTDYAAQAKDRLDMRSQELNDAVANNKSTLDINDAVNHRIDQSIADANASYRNVNTRQDIVNNLNDLRDTINARHEDLSNMSLQDAVNMKRKLADDYPFSPMETAASTSNIMAKTTHQIYHDINSAIEGIAPKITELNQRVSSLIDISKAAQNRMAVESRNNPIGMIGSLLGMGEAFHSGAPQGLLASMAYKTIASPAVFTRVAKGLSNMAEVDKINLYKAAPWFMDLAQKVHDFVANRGSMDVPNMTKNLEGSNVGQVGEGFAEPEISRQPVQNNPNDIGGEASRMQSEGGPATEYVNGPSGTISRQTLRENAAKQNSINPSQQKDDLNYGSQLNAAAVGGAGLATLNASAEDKKSFNLSGVNYTKQAEGFTPHVSGDAKSTQVVGHGFNSSNPSIWKLIPSDVRSGQRDITQKEADAIFPKAYNIARNDAIQFAGNRTWNKMSTSQQKGLTDMSYQMGITSLNKFKNLKVALQGANWDKASKEVVNSDYFRNPLTNSRANRNAILMGK